MTLDRSATCPPSPAGRAAVAAMLRFLDETALPLVAELEREHPDTAFALEPDGRLAEPVHGLKRALHQASAAAGLYCPHLPEADGGLGLSLVDCAHLQAAVYGHGLRGQQWALAWTDGPSPVVAGWSAQARERWLPDFLAGRITCAFALTEPGAGSDFPALVTTADRDGNSWRLHGVKHLITGAPQAELAQVFCRIEGARRGELTCFVVPLDAEGVERGEVQQTIMADGQTGPIRLDGVRVTRADLVGEPGGAQPFAFRWINWARTRRAGMCAGLGRFCLDRSLGHATAREAYGRPLAELGPVAAMLADMTIDLEAMAALSLELLSRLDSRGTLWERPSADDRHDVSVLKTFCDEALERIADRAIQVHGGSGLLTGTGVEKVFRVARNLRIPAGTVEVQRAIIGRALTA